MKTKRILLSLTVLLSIFAFTYAESTLFSRYPTSSPGKQVVSIHSFSSQTKWQEGPINMLFESANVDEDKWCDNTSAEPWVIFELANYYNINKFVITDAQIREKNNGNIDEYKIFVTKVPYDKIINGWDDSDWIEVYHGIAEGEDIIKTAELDNPVEARYVKLEVISKGYRPDNGNYENAIRIYGFDMYGEFSANVDRGELISVGKTILKFEEKPTNFREWAYNILDGNIINKNAKWGIPSYGQENNYHYVIIDLEGMYDINGFKLFDADYVEFGSKNLDGVNIYVSKIAPNLNVINMIDDDPNTNWTKIVDSSYESDYNLKEYTYSSGDPLWSAPITGRFVKLEIPAMKAPGADPNQFTRIFQFEVYGNETEVPANDATLSLLTVSDGVIAPDFSVAQTNYSVNVPKEVSSITINASPNNKDATVTGAGTKELHTGANTFEIVVNSKDGTQSITYVLTVNRAEKSKIATLKSLNSSVGFISPAFSSNTVEYFIDVPYGTNEITLSGVPTQENAVIQGLGKIQLSGNTEDIMVSVNSEDGSVAVNYIFTIVPEQEGLISVNYGMPDGKRIVNVHSYSGKVNDNENPYKLLLGERINTNGNTTNKWCDNKNTEPWVIFSLTDIYEINKIVIRDGRLVEFNNDNVANVSYYSVEVSTTGINEYDFEEIDSDWPEEGTNTIVINHLKDNARYIKFTFGRGTKIDGNIAGAIWIYGIDIYGKKVEDIDRGEIVSVGKTIHDYSNYFSDRETPSNILDGNVSYDKEDYNTGEFINNINDPWAFISTAFDEWVVIDLEKEYYIDSLKLYDTNDWIKGYKLLINSNGNAEDSNWTEVYDGTFNPITEEYEDENFELKTRTIGPDPKVGILNTQAKSRYIKLLFPKEYQSGGFNRIREFEVYGSEAPAGLINLKSNNQTFEIYPNPIKQGENITLKENGTISIFSLQGNLVYQGQSKTTTSISTANLSQGSYIIQVSNENGVKNAKLIVR